jgi:hypothetical protein
MLNETKTLSSSPITAKKNKHNNNKIMGGRENGREGERKEDREGGKGRKKKGEVEEN